MTPAQAAELLGVPVDSAPEAVRRAYRQLIQLHHPDRAGTGSQARASAITEAYSVLSSRPPGPEVSAAPEPERPPPTRPIARLSDDSLGLAEPPDEAFGLLLDAVHDVGEVTYLDRSMPIVEVLCRFEGEPATSLVLTVQGRGSWTEVFATAESIEARPAPAVGAVVDLLELALHRRAMPT